jgi:hypothetical protein
MPGSCKRNPHTSTLSVANVQFTSQYVSLLLKLFSAPFDDQVIVALTHLRTGAHGVEPPHRPVVHLVRAVQ